MSQDRSSSPTRTDAISDVLRDEILRGQYRTGERLPSERDLAARFDANRGAVREALKRLEQLGLTHIQPGGARVAPVTEASLDVIGHLINLGDVPDPALVDEVMEVIGALMSIAVRRVIRRADAEELATARRLLANLRARDLSYEQRLFSRMQLAEFFMGRADSLVVHLIARSLGMQFSDRIPFAELARSNTSSEPRLSLLDALDRAIVERDAPAAGSAMSDLIDITRAQLKTLLSSPQSAAEPKTGAAYTSARTVPEGVNPA